MQSPVQSTEVSKMNKLYKAHACGLYITHLRCLDFLDCRRSHWHTILIQCKPVYNRLPATWISLLSQWCLKVQFFKQNLVLKNFLTTHFGNSCFDFLPSPLGPPWEVGTAMSNLSLPPSQPPPSSFLSDLLREMFIIPFLKPNPNSP